VICVTPLHYGTERKEATVPTQGEVAKLCETNTTRSSSRLLKGVQLSYPGEQVSGTSINCGLDLSHSVPLFSDLNCQIGCLLFNIYSRQSARDRTFSRFFNYSPLPCSFF
jgi:hypothetical protein